MVHSFSKARLVWERCLDETVHSQWIISSIFNRWKRMRCTLPLSFDEIGWSPRSSHVCFLVWHLRAIAASGLYEMGSKVEWRGVQLIMMLRSQVCYLLPLTIKNPTTLQIDNHVLGEGWNSFQEQCCGPQKHPIFSLLIEMVRLTMRRELFLLQTLVSFVARVHIIDSQMSSWASSWEWVNVFIDLNP